MNRTEEHTQWPSLFFPDVKVQKDISRLQSFVGLKKALRWQLDQRHFAHRINAFVNVLFIVGSTPLAQFELFKIQRKFIFDS